MTIYKPASLIVACFIIGVCIRCAWGREADPLRAPGTPRRATGESGCRSLAACTMEFIPHCGSNGRTYANKCQFKVAQCNENSLRLVKPAGEACGNNSRRLQSSPPDVIQPNKPSERFCAEAKDVLRCPADYSPHCGSNGVTYPNNCYFKAGQCYDAALTLAKEPGESCDGSVSPLGRIQIKREPTPRTEGDDFCSRALNKQIQCGTNVNPQCASDGTMYINDCRMQVAQCKNGSLSVVASGELCLLQMRRTAVISL